MCARIRGRAVKGETFFSTAKRHPRVSSSERKPHFDAFFFSFFFPFPFWRSWRDCFAFSRSNDKKVFWTFRIFFFYLFDLLRESSLEKIVRFIKIDRLTNFLY